MNGLFEDMTTSGFKALVSDVMSRNQTWKSMLRSDYLMVIDVSKTYSFFLLVSCNYMCVALLAGT